MQYIGKVVVGDGLPSSEREGYYRVRVPQLHGISLEDQEKVIQGTKLSSSDTRKYYSDSLTDEQLPRFLAPKTSGGFQSFENGDLVLVGFTSNDMRSNGIILGSYGEVEELVAEGITPGSTETSVPPSPVTTGSVTIPGGSTPEGISSWLGSVVGHSAFERGGASGTQCVEIVHQYLEDCFGKPQDSNGNGMDVAGRVAERFPSDFTFIGYNSMVSLGGPRQGDIISFNSGSAPKHGHVAIVSQTYNGSTYTIVHQWKGSMTVRTQVNKIIAPKYGVSDSIIGVARPTSF